MAGQRGRQGDTGRVGDTGRTGDEGPAGDTGGAGGIGETGEQGARGKPGTPLNTALMYLLGAAALTLVLIAVVLSTVTLLQANKIDKNSDRIAALSTRTAEREARDTQKLREAAWRGCQRDQLERADAYAGQRAFLESPESQGVFPQKLIDQAIARRQANLPIFNCDPNMCDGSATVLSPKEQEHFVDRYIASKLAPDPEPPKVDCPG